MQRKLLFVVATGSEAESLKNVRGIKLISGGFSSHNCLINLLITGIGSVATSWAMSSWLSSNPKPDLVINGGIAGSYKAEFKTGDVVLPVTDCFADSGIEDGEKFQTMFDAGLMGSDEFPYREGLLYADPLYLKSFKGIIRPVRAITVNTATGSEGTREKLLVKFNPDIETMEGAAFFYTCIREQLPFFALRAISNMVERRDRTNWNIPLAINNLSVKLEEIIRSLD